MREVQMPIKNNVGGHRVSPEKRQFAKRLRREATPAENRLWQSLRGNRLNGLHFRRQHVIAGYIVDFYCHARALIIEVDGPIHASQVEADAQREQHLRRRGYRIMRFSNEEVFNHTEMVLAAIRKACEEPIPQDPISPPEGEKDLEDEEGPPLGMKQCYTNGMERRYSVPKVKTAISIDNDLLEETAVIAQELDIPRSQVVSLALEDYIRRYRNKQLLEQINAAYDDAPDAEDTAALEMMRAHRRKLGEDDKWQ